MKLSFVIQKLAYLCNLPTCTSDEAMVDPWLVKRMMVYLPKLLSNPYGHYRILAYKRMHPQQEHVQLVFGGTLSGVADII